MFSPGELTAKSQPDISLQGFDSHAEFERECDLCHRPLHSFQADLCIACHTEIRTDMEIREGTHGNLEVETKCFSCHSDHQGSEFDPTMDALTSFDHRLASFSLLQHQVDYSIFPIECRACHDFSVGSALLPDACTTCHAQYDLDFMEQHTLDFGADCLTCHDGLDTIVQFNHASSNFPLVGEHFQIACVECHQDGQFKNTPLNCASCHAEPDIHQGLFSQDCATCHTPDQWNLVIWDGQTYDHFVLSSFSLASHLRDFSGAQMKCASCHLPQDGAHLGFDLNSCVTCHETDDSFFMTEHQQQFGSDCLACHDGTGRLANFDHNLFFTLDGRHADATCESCHLNRTFQDTPRDCAACHAEPEIHLGLFGLTCENCHSTQAWSPASLTNHTFPLDHGEQGMVACETCHETSYVAYTCYGCHEHQPAEIQREHREEGISAIELVECVNCHPNGLEDEAEGD